MREGGRREDNEGREGGRKRGTRREGKEEEDRREEKGKRVTLQLSAYHCTHYITFTTSCGLLCVSQNFKYMAGN